MGFRVFLIRSRNPEVGNPMNFDKRWSLETRIYKPQIVYVGAIIVLASLVLWLAALFFVYLADDWNSPAADERSIPAVRTY